MLRIGIDNEDKINKWMVKSFRKVIFMSCLYKGYKLRSWRVVLVVEILGFFLVLER